MPCDSFSSPPLCNPSIWGISPCSSFPRIWKEDHVACPWQSQWAAGCSFCLAGGTGRLPGVVLTAVRAEAAEDTVAFWAGGRGTWLSFWPLALPLIGLGLWVSRVTSRGLCFLICKMGIKNAHPPRSLNQLRQCMEGPEKNRGDERRLILKYNHFFPFYRLNPCFFCCLCLGTTLQVVCVRVLVYSSKTVFPSLPPTDPSAKVTHPQHDR